jgi:3-hydroxyisobutyrate dehydrogenase-like beta-hydroxyacid dehydrogenase
MRIAILGTGRMGTALAGRLLEKGHEVTVWNRTRQTAEPLASRGATVAESVRQAVEGAEVSILLLSNDAAVRAVTPEAVGALPDNAILVDSSTVSPHTSRWLAEQTPRFVAAPILGHPGTVGSGQAQLLLGGPDAAIDRLAPLWSDMSTRQVRCGAAPNASTMKILSNLILIGETALMAEAVVTAQTRGIGDETVRQVFAESPVIGPGVRTRLEDVMSGEHEGLFSVRLARKDMRLALDLAGEAGLTLSTAQGAERELQETELLGRGQDDLGAVVEAVRKHGSRRQ